MTTDLDLCVPCPLPAADTGRHANDAILRSHLRQGSA
jgi:hypothetical protein